MQRLSRLIFLLLGIVLNSDIKEWQEHIQQIHRMFRKGK